MQTASSQSTSPKTFPDFDNTTLPWVDRPDFMTQLESRIKGGAIPPEMVLPLIQWHKSGYVVFKSIIDEGTISKIMEDYERIWAERPPCRIQVGNQYGLMLDTVPPRSQIVDRYRLLDIHSISVAARKTILHPTIVKFFEMVHESPTVAMQSLFFENGSEQSGHQDFAFVPSGILSHLGASWIALEDVTIEQGPLFYIPGSHRINKFDFGNGELVFQRGNTSLYGEWMEHLKQECASRELNEEVFLAKKGDVLLWHGALVHGGRPILTPGATRHSLVAHYSDVHAFPEDYRTPGKAPQIIKEGDGICYAWDYPGHAEGSYSF